MTVLRHNPTDFVRNDSFETSKLVRNYFSTIVFKTAIAIRVNLQFCPFLSSIVMANFRDTAPWGLK